MTLTAIIWPLAGGLLIGLAAAVYLLCDGRVAGISGITASATGLSTGGNRRLAITFTLGLVLGSAFAALSLRTPELEFSSSLPLLIAGGLITGFGTRLGSGCTSGHGVCGMARLSKRSILATVIFMGVAGVTVYVLRHLIGGAA